MAQAFKDVYFPDYPSNSPQKKHLTLAFGLKDRKVFTVVKDLSSHELREVLKHPTFTSLKQAAEQEGLAINTYCLRLLRRENNRLAHEPHPVPMLGTKNSLIRIDPIQATFRGGRSEPMHRWYPFLEGYSPEFVERTLNEFAPQARNILDPFGGAGTTPITAARLGRRTFYCELNPLLQYTTTTKILALRHTGAVRHHLIADLNSLAARLCEDVRTEKPDVELDLAYTEAFGNSRFFDERTYSTVLRLRSLIDRVGCTAPLTARFLAIAVIANLIPASLLIRRGDVRFKNAVELAKSQTNLLDAVRGQLLTIAQDLGRLPILENLPLLLCENARNLNKVPPQSIDAVITSPPYLNGTNYFRNTKVELWFLRCLKSSNDLASFRFRAITAGINDVTVGKSNGRTTNGVEAVVEKLTESAYDQRIPLMVRTYFSDMKTVFASINHHLADAATLVIDIGDSAYSGIHVPTPALLSELLETQGFTLDHEITLRRRMSRSAIPLRQVLLILTKKPNHRHRQAKKPKTADKPWKRRWDAFRQSLPHQQGDFSRRNWGHPLHSLCSYQGKMKPSLAYHLVRTFATPGGTILDPFGGVGTIPFEAALQGVRAWTFEINPAALHISAAKLSQPIRSDCEALLDALAEFIRRKRPKASEQESAAAIRFNGPLPGYFHPDTLSEILLARRFFIESPPCTPSHSLVFASLLHILHGNRPYALSRRSHPITPFAPTGPTEYRPLTPRLRDKVERSLAVEYPADFVGGHAIIQDATSWWPQEIDNLDAIITSPPFFDSTRFYLANWMRLWFCGWENADFKSQPLAFVDERQKQDFSVYEPVFRQARERLKLGGVMVMHLGKSKKCDMAAQLTETAKPWFRTANIFAENVTHCESHGIRDKGTVQEHSYLVLN